MNPYSLPIEPLLPRPMNRLHAQPHWLEDALARWPVWDEYQTILPPRMAWQLRLGQRAQVVQVGSQATLALLTAVKGPLFENGTVVKTRWLLSETPYGPLVVCYVRVAEPGSAPSTLEIFLPIFRRSHTEPLEGAYLLQTLIRANACCVVFADEGLVMLNRRVVLDVGGIRQIRELVQRLASARSPLLQRHFLAAKHWHRANCLIQTLEFD